MRRKSRAPGGPGEGGEGRVRAPGVGVDGAMESLPPPRQAEMLQPHRPPRSWHPPILPLPALQRIFASHPSAPGSPSRTAAKGGAGPSPQSGWGCCASQPEKRPVPKGEITRVFFFLLPPFPRRRLVPGPQVSLLWWELGSRNRG